MASAPSPVGDVFAVTRIIGDIVASERQHYRQHAADLLAEGAGVAMDAEFDERFLRLSTLMMSSKKEFDKWEPLLEAMRQYKGLEAASTREETEQVWYPVWVSLKLYRAARSRALDYERPQAISGRASESEGPGVAKSRSRDQTGTDSVSAVAAELARTSLAPDSAARPSPSAAPSRCSQAHTHQSSVGATAHPSAERDAPDYDKNFLASTAGALREAVTKLDAICMKRMSAWGVLLQSTPGRAVVEQALAVVRLGTDVSCALDASSVEMQKQIVVMETPCDTIFSLLGVQVEDALDAVPAGNRG